MHFDEVLRRPLTRRGALKAGTAAALATQFTLLEQSAWAPERLALAAGGLPDIQFDIGNFIAPAFTVNGVLVRFGPVYTLFAPGRLTRTPSAGDQRLLAGALDAIEARHQFSPSGVFTFVAYGVPYFERLPASVVAAHMPLTGDTHVPVLEEAVACPTDVVAGNGVTKRTFNVPVTIESNDMLFTLRSDSLGNLADVLVGLQGRLRGLVQFQTPRLMFQQIGLTRKVADALKLPYARQINPQSPMWMGFADQQVNAAAPAQQVTFQGNATARLSTAKAGDYFDNGSIQHLSHDILDMAQFFELPNVNPDAPDGETYLERVQYMFRSNQLGTPHGVPSEGNADQFTDGGGPSFLANVFQGTQDAAMAAQAAGGKFTPQNAVQTATFTGVGRIGHISALQRSSRAADGSPLHIRMDGAGLSSMDVPDGSFQPKLEFTVFVPSGQFFRVMRANTAALDLQQKFGVDPDDNGLERFTTATRRQNFLVPPRRHRAFPLVELAGGGSSTGWRLPFGR